MTRQNSSQGKAVSLPVLLEQRPKYTRGFGASRWAAVACVFGRLSRRISKGMTDLIQSMAILDNGLVIFEPFV